MKFISRYAGYKVHKAAGYIQFVNGTYVTEDADEIDFLRNLPEYGTAVCGIEDEDLQVDAWVCDICGKAFSTRQGFASHMRIHKQEV